MLGVEHALGISSGTDALLVALMALGIGAGDEVLCPAFTFFATAGCVTRVSAKPVFVDVDPATFNIDINSARLRITKRTKAIIPVHLFGQCADMQPILELAREHDFAVIEDAAQAIGATYRGQNAGTIGTFGAFSFYPTKNLGGLGDGGLLICRDETLARQARALRNHGAEKTYYHSQVGGNFRLDALQASFLRVKLKELPNYTARRREHANYYTEKLSKLPHTVLGSDHPNDPAARLILPGVQPECGPVWNQYTVRVPHKRDALRDFLGERGIQSAIYYPLPLNQQQCFASCGQQRDCPVSAHLASVVLSLPIYAELREAQLAAVVEAIGEFLA
jgi:dTDP-4-amino-4,6-dideoxygalactose transaminase